MNDELRALRQKYFEARDVVVTLEMNLFLSRLSKVYSVKLDEALVVARKKQAETWQAYKAAKEAVK